MVKVIKKDDTIENFDSSKIIVAIHKASDRVVSDLSEDKVAKVVAEVKNAVKDKEYVSINELHNLVEIALNDVDPKIANSYKEYRNYKRDFVNMMDEVYQESEKIRYIGDRDNANTDSTMVSTQRSLIYQKLNKELYKKFFLNKEERQAINDGYIYIHDMGARLDSPNCSLLDVGNILDGGFEMGNLWYNEPKSLDVAFDVISDIVLNFASCMYGGTTMSEVDKLLNKYAIMSYEKYCKEYFEMLKISQSTDVFGEEREKEADYYASKKVYRDFEQGFQAWVTKQLQ